MNSRPIQEGLGEPVGVRLLRMPQQETPLASVPEEPLEV